MTGEEQGQTATLEDTARLFDGNVNVRNVALTGLFVLALFYTLYFAREFVLPVVLAVVFNFLLWPAVRALKRVKIPEVFGAAIVLVAVLGAAGTLAYQLSGPVALWLERAPGIVNKLERQLREWKKPVQQVTKASEQVEKITAMGAAEKPQQVEIKRTTFADTLFSQTWTILFGAMVLLILLYFLLASGDLFLRKLVKVLPTLQDKKRAVQIAHEIEDRISRYLLTVTLINGGLAVCASALLWFLGMPNPVLWGAMAGLFNFVPYLGAATSIGVFLLVSAATFNEPLAIVGPPLGYFVLTVIEGNFVTPWIMGARFTLNPVVIFVTLIFWGWLWGIAGALLAVPLLAMFKIFCDHIEPLAPLAEFLGN